MRFLFVCIWFLIGFHGLQAQTLVVPEPEKKTETTKPGPKVKKHSPATATWLSAVLPGAGQVYNRRNWWWKVPIIYAAGAGFVYGINFYQENYNDFKDAYKYRIETGSDTNGDPRFDKFQTPTLKSIRDSYRTARDECFIGLMLVYTLQILDASVEAHFLEFNVNDDLSLNVNPVYVPSPNNAYAGIQFVLTLK